MSEQNECRASANVPVPAEPADERNLYCVLREGHEGAHYDDGAGIMWSRNAHRLPQSSLGGLHPELRARITAADAVLGDFKAEHEQFAQVAYESWAGRLEAELRGLLETIGRLS